MKFVKGMLVGSFVSASLVIAYTETLGKDKKEVYEKRKASNEKNGNILNKIN